mmetsp:Transcript_24709/g.44745  ORF Transcript_24709/g.44745 Transcript_24709/m.44745 type:complete len:202 (+) Transcript_24709:894-1499(+)
MRTRDRSNSIPPRPGMPRRWPGSWKVEPVRRPLPSTHNPPSLPNNRGSSPKHSFTPIPHSCTVSRSPPFYSPPTDSLTDWQPSHKMPWNSVVVTYFYSLSYTMPNPVAAAPTNENPNKNNKTRNAKTFSGPAYSNPRKRLILIIIIMPCLQKHGRGERKLSNVVDFEPHLPKGMQMNPDSLKRKNLLRHFPNQVSLSRTMR